MPPLPFSREISFFLQSHGYIPVLHSEKIAENWPGGTTISLRSRASSFSRTSSELFHVAGCDTAYIDLPSYHHQDQVPDVPSDPGYDVPLQLSISFCLFRSAVCQIQLRLLFSCGNPDTRNDLDLISAFSYVSMRMSCKTLLLLCLSYFFILTVSVSVIRSSKKVIAANKCTDVWINSFQSKPPNLFPEFTATKKTTCRQIAFLPRLPSENLLWKCHVRKALFFRFSMLS